MIAKIPSAIVTELLTFVTELDTCSFNSRPFSRTRPGCMPGCGAGAVPARGLATRSRAALGISPSALGPGREVRRWTQGQAGAGNTRLTKAATSQEAWPEAEPRTTTRPLGENRGGTPIDVRLPYRGRGRARKARQITALRLSAFCFRCFFVCFRSPDEAQRNPGTTSKRPR